jgi:SAM-dependent methyltransferase
MLLKRPYFPRPTDSRMGNVGDLLTARKIFYDTKPQNLWHLMRKRFDWMNRYIDSEKGIGVEVGCGIGVAKDFVRAKSIVLTDYAESPWLDRKMVDAMSTPFADASFDFVICMNMIHHLPNAMKFLDEMQRILKPGGVLLVQDMHASFLARLALRLMRKEGYSFEPDVFDKEVILSDPANPWSGNNAIAELLFNDPDKFHKNVPHFRIEQDERSECFMFLNSGGVTAKTVSVPLPLWALRAVQYLDKICVRLAPDFFAMQRSIALRNCCGLVHEQGPLSSTLASRR